MVPIHDDEFSQEDWRVGQRVFLSSGHDGNGDFFALYIPVADSVLRPPSVADVRTAQRSIIRRLRSIHLGPTLRLYEWQGEPGDPMPGAAFRVSVGAP